MARNETWTPGYINLQEPFRRTPDGIDSQDLELDEHAEDQVVAG
jgi:hypothetical protein